MTGTRIVTCDCGANVRLPPDAASRSLRCPKCKAGIALTVDARVLATTQLKPGDPGATCPICQTSIGTDEFAVTCPQCGQVHHRECWSEVGGCSTYGCKQAPQIEKTESTDQARTGWGDDKKCPVCGETIKSIALRCRYCRTEFDSVDPMTRKDLHRKSEKTESIERLKIIIIALFVVSLIGLCAPITGVVGMIILLPRRDDLPKCGPLLQLLAYASLVLSAIYSLLWIVFLVAEFV